MSATLISATPPQPSWDSNKNIPLHIQTCASGQRIVYGTATGVVIRCLPDQVSFKFKPVETFLGSKKPITCATISPNGRVVAAGDNDGSCYVWLRQRGAWQFTRYRLDKLEYVKLTDLSISPDSRRLAIVGIDKYSKILAACVLVDGGMAIGKIEGHTIGIASVHFRPAKPHHIATGGLDGHLCIHEGPPFKLSRKIIAVPPERNAKVTCVRYSPDGTHLALTASDGSLQLYNGSTYDLTRSVDLSSNLLALSWRPHGGYFAVVDESRQLRLMKGENLQQLQSVTVGDSPDDAPRGVVWSSKGWIVVPCFGGHMKGWRLSQDVPREEASPKAEQLEQELLDFAERERRIAEGLEIEEEAVPAEPEDIEVVLESAALRMTPRLSDTPSLTWFGPRGNPTTCDFDRDSGRLVLGTSLGFLMFMNTNHTVPAAFQVSRLEKDVTVKSCLISSDIAVAVTSDGCLRFYRIKTHNTKGGDVKERVKECLDDARGTVYTPAARAEMVLTATFDVEETPMKLVFLDMAKYIALFCTNGTLHVFSVAGALACTSGTYKPNWSVVLLGRPLAVSATPDGTLMTVALMPTADYPPSKFGTKSEMQTSLKNTDRNGDGDAPTNEEEWIEGDEEEVKETDTPKIVIDTSKPLIELYEIDTAANLEGFRFICVLDHHKQEVSALALNDEGSLLASVDTTKRIMVTEIETRKPIITTQWNYHSTRVTALDWSPDGSKLLSASTNEQFVWDVDNPGSPIAFKEAHTGQIQFIKYLFNNVILSAGSDGILKVYELDFNE